MHFRKAGNRYITLTKKDGKNSKLRKPTVLQLVKNSRQQIQGLLQRFPVTNKERLELVPKTDKTQVNEGMAALTHRPISLQI